MNKKGFTLVELLAVIILLSLLGVFTVSTVLEQTTSNNGSVDATTLKIIKAAAQEYVSRNSEKFARKSGNIYCLDIDKVLATAAVEDINANTKEALSSSKSKVKVIFSKDGFVYDLSNDCVSNADFTPNPPSLKSNMIPIKWDENNNIVKADPNKYGDWYDYTEKRWANALIVSQKYLSALKSLKPGDLILPMNETFADAIFVVWIPAFKYSLNSNTVSIAFTDYDSTEAHPAFDNSTGFWISKFELTYNNQMSSSYNFDAYTNAKYNLENTINNFDSNTDYNFVKNEMNVGMVSNYEWAATAFLANSKYGVGSEKIFPSDKRTGVIRRYNVSSVNLEEVRPILLTSRVQLNANDVYYSEDSVFSSSTRNVTGVYGLSGGAAEWVSDTEPFILSVYATDAAALKATKGRLDSYRSSYDINSGSNYCLSRGGDIKNNGLFAYEFYPCSTSLSSRITIK